MEEKLSAIDEVKNLTEEETLNINGGMMGWIGNIFKLGAGIGAGYCLAHYVDHC